MVWRSGSSSSIRLLGQTGNFTWLCRAGFGSLPHDGRRAPDWLFCWTELDARHIGIFQSLLVTCRLHGIDPYDYLVDVLQRVGQHPASQVAQLTPRVWKTLFAANPLRSDLYEHDRRQLSQ